MEQSSDLLVLPPELPVLEDEEDDFREETNVEEIVEDERRTRRYLVAKARTFVGEFRGFRSAYTGDIDALGAAVDQLRVEAFDRFENEETERRDYRREQADAYRELKRELTRTQREFELVQRERHEEKGRVKALAEALARDDKKAENRLKMLIAGIGVGSAILGASLKFILERMFG